MAQFPRATVVRREDVTRDLMRIWLEPETSFPFAPGQYCTICVSDKDGKPVRGKDGKALWRAYSIVSAPHEERVELFIELVPPPFGNLTPLLWGLREGESVLILPRAKGVFVFDPSYVNHVMVATVTGVVPYVSILRDYFYHQKSGHRFFVLHGASYMDEFGYRNELEDLARCFPETVQYVPTVSRPAEERNALWEGEKGRVNLIIERYLEYFGLSTDDTLVYMCGHPGMIEDVKARCVPSGWHIREERFWTPSRPKTISPRGGNRENEFRPSEPQGSERGGTGGNS